MIKSWCVLKRTGNYTADRAVHEWMNREDATTKALELSRSDPKATYGVAQLIVHDEYVSGVLTAVESG